MGPEIWMGQGRKQGREQLIVMTLRAARMLSLLHLPPHPGFLDLCGDLFLIYNAHPKLFRGKAQVIYEGIR